MICLIAGSNRPKSLSYAIATYYSELLGEANEDHVLLNLAALPKDIAFYFSETTDGNSALEPFRQQIVESNKILFVVPEYNGSFPGILKLLIDNCPYPKAFKEKKVALAGLAAGMFGNLRGLDHLATVMNYLQATTLPYRVHLPKMPYQFENVEDVLTDVHREQIKTQIDLFCKF